MNLPWQEGGRAHGNGGDAVLPPRMEIDSHATETTPVSMGYFSLLPQDCMDKLLTFLSLYDCLKLSRTSLMFMEELNRELKKRRKHMKQSYAYSCLPEQGKYELLTVRDGLKQASNNTFVLPTVRDRMESLHHALPAGHSARAMVLDMIHEIDRDEHDIENTPLVLVEISDEEENISDRFQTVFQIQQNLIRAHRYHAMLLRSAAISSNPSPWNGVQQQGGRILTVQLQQYIGDTLCAAYLMGHSVSGIVEGGLTENAWMDRLLMDANDLDNRVAIHSYHAWIYLHSTLLRVAPFTWEQQRQLGVALPASVHTSSLDVAQGSLLRPHLPFYCGRHSNHTKRVQLWEALGDLSTLCTKLNDFGRLGPTFRGRDLIRSQVIFPTCPLNVSRKFFNMNPSEYSNMSTLSPFLRSWAASNPPNESTMAWLLFMHIEAGRTRPMTVAPPLVIVKSFTIRDPDTGLMIIDPPGRMSDFM